jgi:hypothetical protein
MCTRLHTILGYTANYTHGEKFFHIKNFKKKLREEKPGKNSYNIPVEK